MPTFHLLAIGRDTFDLSLGTSMVAAAVDRFADVGAELLGDAAILTDHDAVMVSIGGLDDEPVDAVVVLQATFADDRAINALAEKISVPILVWSFPEPRTGENLRLNSLCGANLAAFSLRRRHHPAVFLHADPQRCDATPQLRAAIGALGSPEPCVGVSPPTMERLAPASRAAARKLARAVRGRRIGVIGERPDGFAPCDADDDELAATIGVEIDRVPLASLFERAENQPAGSVATSTRRFVAELDMTPEVDAAGLERSSCLHSAMDGLVSDRGWSAFGTRCWPECMTEFGAAACSAQAAMTSDGVPAVCEADVLGAITAMVLHLASGTDPFVADLVDADPVDDTSVLWHCGCAPVDLAARDEVACGIGHPNRHVPLANEFALRDGRITLARISRAGGRLSLVVAGGTMLHRRRAFHGTSGVVHWDLPVGDVVASIFDHGVEHHLAIVYGDHRDTLVALAAEWNIPVIRLGHPTEVPAAAVDPSQHLAVPI